jgi:hypothetical protein
MHVCFIYGLLYVTLSILKWKSVGSNGMTLELKWKPRGIGRGITRCTTLAVIGKNRVEPRTASVSILDARCHSSASGHCTISALYFNQVLWSLFLFMPTSESRSLKLGEILFSLPSVFRSSYRLVLSTPITTSLNAGVSLNNPQKRFGLS